jgi:hypothetical protein
VTVYIIQSIHIAFSLSSIYSCFAQCLHFLAFIFLYMQQSKIFGVWLPNFASQLRVINLSAEGCLNNNWFVCSFLSSSNLGLPTKFKIHIPLFKISVWFNSLLNHCHTHRIIVLCCQVFNIQNIVNLPKKQNIVLFYDVKFLIRLKGFAYWHHAFSSVSCKICVFLSLDHNFVTFNPLFLDFSCLCSETNISLAFPLSVNHGFLT